MHRYVFFVSLVASNTVFGFVPEWIAEVIKATDPKSLEYFVAAESDCPVSQEKAIEVIEAVFIRNKIAPISKIDGTNKFYLNASVECSSELGVNTFAVSVHFAQLQPIPILYEYKYGLIGSYRDEQTRYVEDILRRSVESAIKDFVEVNASK